MVRSQPALGSLLYRQSASVAAVIAEGARNLVQQSIIQRKHIECSNDVLGAQTKICVNLRASAVRFSLSFQT